MHLVNETIIFLTCDFISTKLERQNLEFFLITFDSQGLSPSFTVHN